MVKMLFSYGHLVQTLMFGEITFNYMPYMYILVITRPTHLYL